MHGIFPEVYTLFDLQKVVDALLKLSKTIELSKVKSIYGKSRCAEFNEAIENLIKENYTKLDHELISYKHLVPEIKRCNKQQKGLLKSIGIDLFDINQVKAGDFAQIDYYYGMVVDTPIGLEVLSQDGGYDLTECTEFRRVSKENEIGNPITE